MVDMVTLRCTNGRCSATMQIKRDRTIPARAVEVRSACPKHEKDGGFGGESYFDAKGREVTP